jgi:hypothetical protein
MSYLLSRNSRVEEGLIDQLFNSSERSALASVTDGRLSKAVVT